MIWITGLALLLAGGFSMLCAALLAAVRKQVQSLVNSVPRDLHGFVQEMVPEASMATNLLAKLPRLIWVCVGIGGFFILLGWIAIPAWWAKVLLLLLGGFCAAAWGPAQKHLTPFLQQKVRRWLETSNRSKVL